MIEIATPELPGYAAVERHACDRCGRLARIRYVATAAPQVELEPPYRYGIDAIIHRVAGYPGGAVALASAHAPIAQDWFWGAAEHCGFALVSGGGEPESLINAIYRRLVRHEETTERIVDFDPARFFSAFSVLATSDIGGAPLRLVAAPAMLRAILSTGDAPANLRESFDVGELPSAELRRAFVAAIGARTRPLA